MIYTRQNTIANSLIRTRRQAIDTGGMQNSSEKSATARHMGGRMMSSSSPASRGGSQYTGNKVIGTESNIRTPSYKPEEDEDSDDEVIQFMRVADNRSSSAAADYVVSPTESRIERSLQYRTAEPIEDVASDDPNYEMDEETEDGGWQRVKSQLDTSAVFNHRSTSCTDHHAPSNVVVDIAQRTSNTMRTACSIANGSSISLSSVGFVENVNDCDYTTGVSVGKTRSANMDGLHSSNIDRKRVVTDKQGSIISIATSSPINQSQRPRRMHDTDAASRLSDSFTSLIGGRVVTKTTHCPAVADDYSRAAKGKLTAAYHNGRLNFEMQLKDFPVLAETQSTGRDSNLQQEWTSKPPSSSQFHSQSYTIGGHQRQARRNHNRHNTSSRSGKESPLNIKGGLSRSNEFRNRYGVSGLRKRLAGSNSFNYVVIPAIRSAVDSPSDSCRRPADDLEHTIQNVDPLRLGLDINAADNLHRTFRSPFLGRPALPHEQECNVPSEYLVSSHLRERLSGVKMDMYQEDLLFFIFYSFPGELMHMLAAHELYSRDWRYHKERQFWLCRMPDNEPSNKTQACEYGCYYVFDVASWRKVIKEMQIDYDLLDSPPALPYDLVNSLTRTTAAVKARSLSVSSPSSLSTSIATPILIDTIDTTSIGQHNMNTDLLCPLLPCFRTVDSLNNPGVLDERYRSTSRLDAIDCNPVESHRNDNCDSCEKLNPDAVSEHGSVGDSAPMPSLLELCDR